MPRLFFALILTILEGHGHVSPIRSQRVMNATLRLGRGEQ